jgi:DNA-binding response OmpR family regulator
MTSMQRILVIDDDCCMGNFITCAAEAIGFNCFSTTDPVVFLKHLTSDITLIFLDLVMPSTDGVALLRTLGHMQCKVDIVLMSGASQREIDFAADIASTLDLRVTGHLKKPFRLKELEAILQRSKQNKPRVRGLRLQQL